MSFSRAAVAASVLGLYVAPAAANSASACFEYGMDYTGYDILTLSGVDSPSLCMESCTQSSDCMFWSWSSETNTCYLKSSNALLGRKGAENVVSGPRSCLVEEGCFSHGVDYVGYDVSRVEGHDVASAQMCQELCVLEPRCAFFSYKISTRDCYLKSSAAFGSHNEDDDVISGPKVCPQGAGDDSQSGSLDLPEKSCAEGSVEYRSRDVAVNRNVRSAAYCQQLCQSNTACFFWTWDKNRHTCYQKDEHAADFRVTGRQTIGKVSGAKDCLPINPGCQLLDTAFLGAVVRQLRNTASFETCQHNCQNESNCAFWTWDLRTKLCQLRSAAPFGYVSDSSTNGIIAGPKYCPNDDVCVEQADYVGHDIEAIEDGSVSSATECRTICRHTEGCEFWTWVQSTGNCYLKTEDALLGKTNGLASLGRFSGPRECFMHYGSIEPNAAYLDSSATPIKNISTFKECELRCQQDSTCNRWTYLSGTRVCLLVASSDKLEKVPFDGALSGSESNSVKTVNERKCLTPAIKYKNAEMALVSSATSVSDCHFECVNNAACKAFTFEEGVGCYLYDKEPSALTLYPISYPTAVSGTPKCGEDFEGEENTCYEDKIIQGATMYAYNDAECASACAEVPSCMHWTYNPKRRLDSCTLHKSGARQGTCIGSRSGSKAVHAGTYEYSRYDGPSISIADVATSDLCRSQCAENEMQYWTFYPSTKVCKLHDEGNYNRVRDTEAICGTVQDPLA